MPARKLGPRCEAVLDLMLKGYVNEDIAIELKMSERTVDAHLSRLYIIYGIPQRSQCRLKLAVMVTYERHPELIPFLGGDRAAFLGFMSAQDYLKNNEHAPGTRYFSPIGGLADNERADSEQRHELQHSGEQHHGGSPVV